MDSDDYIWTSMKVQAGQNGFRCVIRPFDDLPFSPSWIHGAIVLLWLIYHMWMPGWGFDPMYLEFAWYERSPWTWLGLLMPLAASVPGQVVLINYFKQVEHEVVVDGPTLTIAGKSWLFTAITEVRVDSSSLVIVDNDGKSTIAMKGTLRTARSWFADRLTELVEHHRSPTLPLPPDLHKLMRRDS